MEVVEDPPPRTKTTSIADVFTNIFENISPLQFLKLDQNEPQKKVVIDDWDHHCRLPSYATHMRVMGLVSRDISSYFIRVIPSLTCNNLIFLSGLEFSSTTPIKQ